MAAPDRKLYRPEALKGFSSPDHLEELMPAADAKDWLMIVGAIGLLLLFGVWAVAGSVPTIVTGRGVFTRPRQLNPAQTVAAGRIISFSLRPGDRVRQGDVIARLDQSDVQKRADENRRALKSLEDQDRLKTAAERAHLELQAQQDAMEKAGLERQRESLGGSIAAARALKPTLEAHAESNRKLVKEGLMGFAAKDVSDSESAVSDNDAKIYDFESRLAQIDGQLKQIETRGTLLARQFQTDSTARLNEIDQLRRSIELDTFQILREGMVRSEYSGRVAEVLAAAGQVVAAGAKLLTVEADGAKDDGLISISYYPVKDGKQIRPGMRIQITPDTVERERFGGIYGTVTSVSPVPVTTEGAASTLGNAELARNLMPDGVFIEVQARPETDGNTPSGYRWTSSRGPDTRITPGLTHSSRVTIEGRAPVTYLLPILRETSGVY